MDRELKNRVEGMIWGQCIGDALCMGTHWIYNLEDLNTFYPELKGFELPRAGHYHEGKKAGDFTHYGEAALLLLESVAESGGLDLPDFGRRFFGHFASPSYAGYLDSATRGTIENARLDASRRPPPEYSFQAGADDDQLATATSLAPVVARYHDSPEWLEQVTRATRFRQNHPRSVAYMRIYARILIELLSGTDLHSALHRAEETAAKDSEFGEELRQRFRDVFERKHLSTAEATSQLGQSCPLKSSFPAALVAVVQTPDEFEGTLLRVLAAGGDNAGRAAMAGALLGACLGKSALPQALCDRLIHKDRIATALESLCGASVRAGGKFLKQSGCARMCQAPSPSRRVAQGRASR
jgi:ADP-ribosylglycohydrolase